jgi:hypothetical protein
MELVITWNISEYTLEQHTQGEALLPKERQKSGN